MNSDTGSNTSGAHQLHRALGPRIAIAVVVGSVIGSGIFLKPGTIAAASGNFALILSVWVLGGVLTILGGLCLAELAAMLPRAGGPYVYLREAYGRPIAFLYGWIVTIFLYPAGIGALAVAFIGSFNQALGWRPPAAMEVAMAIAMIMTVAGVNIVGVIWGGSLQMLFTLIKAGFLAAVAFAPFVLIPVVGETIQPENYLSTVKPREVDLTRQFGAVLLAVMWAYTGWEAVTFVAEEIRQPQRNLPIALFVGIGILVALYLAANVAFHGVLSMAEMATAGEHAAEEMLNRLLGRPGLVAMSAVIMCSTLGAINSTLLLAPRITFAMARDGVFFRAFGHVHADYRTPAAAIALMALMAIVLVMAVAFGKYLVTRSGPEGSADSAVITAEEAAVPERIQSTAPEESRLLSKVIASLRNSSTFDLLTNCAIFAASIFYALAVLAVIVLRFRQPDHERPYRTWGYPFVPVTFLTVYAWFLTQVYLTNPLEAWTGLLIMAIGVPAYAVHRAWVVRSAKLP